MKIKFIFSFFIVSYFLFASLAYAEKVCSVCGKVYPDSETFCGLDIHKSPVTLKKVVPKEEQSTKVKDNLDAERRKLEAEREKLKKEKKLFEQQKTLEEEKQKLAEEKKQAEEERVRKNKEEEQRLAQEKKKRLGNEINRDGRFIAYDNGTVLDTKTNLMWAAKDNGSDINWARDNGKDINWYQAKYYCEHYHGGEYTDWRMPTEDELKGLYNSGIGYSDINNNNIIVISGPFVWAVNLRKAFLFGEDGCAVYFKDGSINWYVAGLGVIHRALPVRFAK